MHVRTIVSVFASLALLSITGCPKKDASSEGGKSDKGEKGGKGKDDDGDEKGGGKKAIAIAAGQSIACAVMEDGTVRCWGRGDFGEFGGGKAEARDAATPIEIEGVSGAKSIVIGGDPGSAGDAICVGQKGDKWTCWGHGRVIPGSEGSGYAKPAVVDELTGAKQVVFANGTGYAVMGDGKVKAWTDNNCFNTTGTGKLTGQKGVVTVPDVSGAVAVGATQTNACALLKDGTVTCWGYSGKKQAPTVVEGATDGVSIAGNASGGDTCIVNKAKKIVCWSESQKVSENKLSNVASMSARSQSCALLTSGKVSCFGSYDDYGQGSEKVALEKKITQVAAGQQFNCALDEDGGVSCWGYNRNGQLGNGTLMDSKDPVAVSALGKAKLPKEKDGADQATESKVKQAFDGVPKGCKAAPAVAAKFKYIDGGKLEVKSAYARSEYEGKTIAVSLANYQVDPKKQWDLARGKQLKLGLRFGIVDLKGDKKPMKVDEGVFSMDTKQDRLVYVSVDHRAGSMTIADWGLDGVKAGTVEIKHLDAEWVCGHLSIKTKDSEFDGDFAAAIVK